MRQIEVLARWLALLTFATCASSALTLLTFATCASSAVAQPATGGANDVAPAANHPPTKKTIWDLAVLFEDSAAHLPQDEIRHAIARELGVTVVGPEQVAVRQLSIAAEQNHLVMRFRTPEGMTERLLPMTEDRAQLLALLSLMAGNLARDQRNDLTPTTSPTPDPSPAPAPSAEVAPSTESLLGTEQLPILHTYPFPMVSPRPPYKRQYLGLHVAQDVAFVGGENVCDPRLGQASDNYACFYRDTTDEPFFHTPFPHRDSITSGAVTATTRVLASYDHALNRHFTLGGRVGFAFGGGPPAGQRPIDNATKPPAHAKGTGGTPFMPWHVELRGAFWFLPLSERYLRAFVLAGGGIAQVDAKVEVVEYDCEDAGLLPDGMPHPDEPAGSITAEGTFVPDPNGITPFEQCRTGMNGFYNVKNHKPVVVDAWKKLGQAFIQAGAGGLLAVTADLNLTLEVKLLYTLPSEGIVLQPSLGVVYGL
jgi:hypothetical protein